MIKRLFSRIKQRLAAWKSRMDRWVAEENRYQAKFSLGLRQSWPAALAITSVLAPAPVLAMITGDTVIAPEKRVWVAVLWPVCVFVAFWLFPAMKAAMYDDDEVDATPAGNWRLVTGHWRFSDFAGWLAVGAFLLVLRSLKHNGGVLVHDLSMASALIALGLLTLLVTAEPDETRSGNRRRLVRSSDAPLAFMSFVLMALPTFRRRVGRDMWQNLWLAQKRRFQSSLAQALPTALLVTTIMTAVPSYFMVTEGRWIAALGLAAFVLVVASVSIACHAASAPQGAFDPSPRGVWGLLRSSPDAGIYASVALLIAPALLALPYLVPDSFTFLSSVGTLGSVYIVLLLHALMYAPPPTRDCSTSGDSNEEARHA